MEYKLLLSRGRIGDLELKNKVVMEPISPGMADLHGCPTERTIAYYEERAKGEVGLIIVGATKVNEVHGTVEANQLSIAKDDNIEGFKKLADAIHKHGGKVFVQLAHPGRQTFSALNGNKPVVAPSPIPCIACRQETREMAKEEISGLVEEFANAALRLKLADIDGIELHAAHGYLLNEFLSNYSNKRTDEYGGAIQNRVRILEEIIKAIREKCGNKYPISVRVSVDEFLREFGISNEGITLEEGLEIVKLLEKVGIHVINVSSGTYATTNTIIEPISYEQGWRKHLAKAVKEVVNIPVIAANVIRKPSFAEELLEEGVVDFVGIARGLVAEPQWVSKTMSHREDEITPCISCMNCIESVLVHDKPMECAINYRAGKELQFSNFKKDGEGKTVVIVGAGPAGMEAARILAVRGFKIIVFEKESKVGGQLQLANKPPKKEKINWLIEYMENQLKKLGVEIRLNAEVTVQDLKKINPYAIYIATGANPLVPPMEGVNQENVYTVPDILNGKVKLHGKKVAIIGSGATGLETAQLLAEQGNKITVIEMVSKIGKEIYTPNRIDILRRLNKYNVEMLPSHRVQKIIGNKVILEDLKNKKVVEKYVDCVVLSLGVRPNNTIVDSLKDNFQNVKVIGDSNTVGRIAQAIKDAFVEAYNL